MVNIPVQPLSTQPLPAQPEENPSSKIIDVLSTIGIKFGLFLLIILFFLLVIIFSLAIYFSTRPAGVVEKIPASADLVQVLARADLLDPTLSDQILSGNYTDSRPAFATSPAALRSNELSVYIRQFDFLVTRYYATGKREIFNFAVDWKNLTIEKFPQEAKAFELNGGFTIVER